MPEENITPAPEQTPETGESQGNEPGTEPEKKPEDGGQPTPPQPKAPAKARTFTQEQVNKIMRARLERDRNSFFGRYGVKDRDGLDGLIGKAQAYEIMRERYDASKARIFELEERLAFTNNGINPDREDDIRAYFKGKGIAFNEEALKTELETHPEWRKVIEADPTPKSTIERMGNDHRERDIPETDEEKMNRIYGF